jgi:hypothetical protein
MYNTSISCEYSDLETYQTAVLSAFGVEFSKLNEEIQCLYDKLCTHEKVVMLLKKIHESMSWASPDFAFYLLFSYDYFSYTHPFLIEVLENKPITTFDSFYSIL